MREIKFRGKRIDNGEWVYGYLIEYLKTTWIRVTDKNKDRYYVEFEVIPGSVGQFISLYDRAGDEIYSNSILAPYGNITKKPNMDECFSVEYEKGSYNIGNESDTDYYVVGDTFNNPELLK
jgi:hypothetical protein